MSLKRILARNGMWSAAGMASGMVTGFITAPFLVHRLGQTDYGLWILIVSMTSYFNLVDLGLRASITRHLAFYRAKNDQAAVNAILSTAQAILAAAAMVTVVATFVLLTIFTHSSKLPPDQLANARWALVLSGLTVAIILAMSVFDATLWGYERFGSLNGIEIASDIGQTLLLFYFVGRGGSLVTVASIVLVGTVCTEAAKAVVCFRMDRQLRIAPANVSSWAARQLFGYGLWKFMWSIGSRATAQSGPLIIGARLGAEAVTPYSVASRLVGYARGIATVGTGVLTPTATALHAAERHDHQQQLFLEGGKYCLALSLFVATGIILLGKPFISFWMGDQLVSAWKPATVLALGEILPMSQWVTYSILLGRERHRVVACASFVETFVVIGAGLALANSFGLMGVCLAVAIPGAVGRGLLPIVYGCRVLDVPLRRYVTHVLVPPLLAVAVPAGGLALLVYNRPPKNWLELVCYGGVFSLSYFVACCVAVVGLEQIKRFAARVKGTAGQGLAQESEAVR